MRCLQVYKRTLINRVSMKGLPCAARNSARASCESLQWLLTTVPGETGLSISERKWPAPGMQVEVVAGLRFEPRSSCLQCVCLLLLLSAASNQDACLYSPALGWPEPGFSKCIFLPRCISLWKWLQNDEKTQEDPDNPGQGCLTLSREIPLRILCTRLYVQRQQPCSSLFFPFLSPLSCCAVTFVSILFYTLSVEIP